VKLKCSNSRTILSGGVMLCVPVINRRQSKQDGYQNNVKSKSSRQRTYV